MDGLISNTEKIRIWGYERICDKYICIEYRSIHLKLGRLYKNSVTEHFLVAYKDNSFEKRWKWAKNSWEDDYCFLVTDGVYPECRPIIHSYNTLWKKLFRYGKKYEVETVPSDVVNEIANLVALCQTQRGNPVSKEECFNHPKVRALINVLFRGK